MQQDRYARAMAVLAQFASAPPVRTDIPARLDRLPWSRWHWLLLVALGTLWALVGFETGVVATMGPTITQSATLGITTLQVGVAAAIYLLGVLVGAPVFGYLADISGRRQMFMAALAIFLAGSFLTALSFGFLSFCLFRLVTGAGVGGLYVTINSAVAELVPPRLRGQAVLGINGSFWLGALLGSALTTLLLEPALLPLNTGWRVCLLLGAILLLGFPLARRQLPESPRQLIVQARFQQANGITSQIEMQVRRNLQLKGLPKPGNLIVIRPRGPIPLVLIANTLLRDYTGRSILALALITAQAFLLNGALFSYGLVLSGFYGVDPSDVGFYLWVLAAAALLGPWTLGRFFDTRGRRALLGLSYMASGLLLAITAFFFAQGALDPLTLTAAWVAVLFFASAGGAGAYLTSTELFPQELRATTLGIALAFGALAGIVGSVLFAGLTQTGSAGALFYGYLAAAVLMALAGAAGLLIGVRAERRTLEGIARPLSTETVRAEAPRSKRGKRRAA